MKSWWRVLKGVKPYLRSVIISMLCALGVGLSYAAGVGVLLPVMKIFVSDEGVHGWANRTGAEQRLQVSLFDLDFTTKMAQPVTKGSAVEGAAPLPDPNSVVVLLSDDKTISPLNGHIATGSRIIHVKNLDGSAITLADSRNWQDMVWILSHAPTGSHIQIDVVDKNGLPVLPDGKPLIAVLPPLSFINRIFIGSVDLLSKDPTQALAEVVAFFIFLCFVGSAFRYFQQYLGMTVANRVIMDLRRKMYDRVTQLPTSYFAQKGTSDLMSRLTQDTNTLTDGVSMAFGKAVQEPVKALFSFGLAMVLDWRLCLLIVLTIPILGFIIRKFSKRMRKASRRALENWSSMLAIINETLIGARVVKAYSAEGFERRRFAQVNKRLLKEQNKLSHYGSLSRPTIETIAVILSSIPMIIAAHFVFNHTIDRDKFITLLACFAAMLEPMRKLSDVNARVQQSNAAATRVFEIIDMDPEPNYSHALPHLPRHEKQIEFRDITFNYPGHEENVLKNVSLTVQFGQNVAVVGGNGSGKTTLLQLLPRLYTPTTGAILIDGVDAATVSLRSLRKQIGLVTQDTLLFADTIYNNIAYGFRHSTRDQVIDAARRAYADEFIRNLPLGYETRVGEHGVRLSGGQKQRLAIARAILHNPAILILDEAMSQIDSDSEMQITQALREFTKNRTTLAIAHRFSTVISADLIVCLDTGRIAGVGTHSHLLATCPPYRKLFETQFREIDTTPAEAISPVAALAAAAIE